MAEAGTRPAGTCRPRCPRDQEICRPTRWSLFRATDFVCLAHGFKANVQALRQWDRAVQVLGGFNESLWLPAAA